MDDEKTDKAVAVVPTPAEDEEVAEFVAFLMELAEARGDGTEVAHIDIDEYRKGRRA